MNGQNVKLKLNLGLRQLTVGHTAQTEFAFTSKDYNQMATTSAFNLIELDFIASWDVRTSQNKIKVLETLLSAFNSLEERPVQTVRQIVSVPAIDNGEGWSDNVTMSELDADKGYILSVYGYTNDPMILTSVNRQDDNIVRVSIINQTGMLVNPEQITITAISI